MNGLSLGDRALLWSDTLYLDPHTGKTIGYQEKVFRVTAFPAAVAMTSVGGPPHVIPEMVGSWLEMTFVPNLQTLLEACAHAAREFVKVQPEIAAVRLLIAGWCDECECVRMFMLASDQWHPDVEPFAPGEIGYFVSGGKSSDLYKFGETFGFTPALMRDLADIQQTEPIAPDKGGFTPMMGIGGNLIEYEVTKHGVTGLIVREWGVPADG